MVSDLIAWSLPWPAPKSLSSAQNAVITEAGTPNSFSSRANKAACFFTCAIPPATRPTSILFDISRKFCAKNFCPRSILMMRWSSTM